MFKGSDDATGSTLQVRIMALAVGVVEPGSGAAGDGGHGDGGLVKSWVEVGVFCVCVLGLLCAVRYVRMRSTLCHSGGEHHRTPLLST